MGLLLDDADAEGLLGGSACGEGLPDDDAGFDGLLGGSAYGLGGGASMYDLPCALLDGFP